MKHLQSLAILLILLALPWAALAEKTPYFFGKETRFDQNIPTPEAFLGYELGTRG